MKITERGRMLWLSLFGVGSVAFFVLAVSDVVYELTTPENLLGIALRKLYSVVCFGALGFFLAMARIERLRTPAVGGIIACYSGAIEVAQRLAGTREGFYLNLADVAFGFVGGIAGAALATAAARTAGRAKH